MSLGLAFGVSGIDCSCSSFYLLTTSVTPSSIISIPLGSQGLLGAQDAWNLQGLERRMSARLISAAVLTVGHGAGLLIHIDANYVANTRGCQSL